jgi:hypothetical protein
LAASSEQSRAKANVPADQLVSEMITAIHSAEQILEGMQSREAQEATCDPITGAY